MVSGVWLTIQMLLCGVHNILNKASALSIYYIVNGRCGVNTPALCYGTFWH